MKNYKQIFDEVERTLFEVGSRNLSKAKIKSELDKFKHYEGKRYTNDEIFRKLIHIAFYSGFKAQIVSDKISVIDGHFPSYKTVADFGKNQIEIIANDPAMIRHRSKIAACVKNAQTLRNLIINTDHLTHFCTRCRQRTQISKSWLFGIVLGVCLATWVSEPPFIS